MSGSRKGFIDYRKRGVLPRQAALHYPTHKPVLLSRTRSALIQLQLRPSVMSDCYRKHFFPLESDPAIFTELSHLLGSPASLIFEDVLSLDEAERLPHPALALVLVLPTTAVYEKRKQHEDALYDVCPQADLEEDVVWFKQTINNACGLYALLHALANSEARCMIREFCIVTASLHDANESRTEFRHG